MRMRVPLSVLRGARLPSDPWTPRDAALAQAAEMLDRSRCPGCGTPLWLAYDPKLEKKWESPLPNRCHPCTAKSQRMKQYEGDDVTHRDALHFDVHQVD